LVQDSTLRYLGFNSCLMKNGDQGAWCLQIVVMEELVGSVSREEGGKEKGLVMALLVDE
jgi:hypothetical protein